MSSNSPDKDLFDDLMIDDDFDPLEDSLPDDDEEEESVELIGATTLAQSPRLAVVVQDERSPEERTAELFQSMTPQRKALLGILSFLSEPQTAEAVNAEVDRLQKNNYAVYTAANYCTLLEKAGAIDLVTADGKSFADAKVEPQIVVEDGVEYYEPGAPPQPFWAITAAGSAYLAADQPLQRLHEIFTEDAAYLPIYERILTLCSAEGGANRKVLDEAVDDDPLVQEPRLFATRFVDRLEKCDAIVWAKSWTITDIGRSALELLAKEG